MLQINSSIIDFIISVIIGVILMRIVIWYAKLMGYIPDFKKKKNESIIIAEENNWKETSDFSDRLKIYRKKKVKWILLWILMTIPITIVSLVFFPIYSKIIIYFFVVIPTLLIIIIFMFQEAKAFGRQPLSTSKLLASIILIIFLFIFITLYFFEMIPIF